MIGMTRLLVRAGVFAAGCTVALLSFSLATCAPARPVSCSTIHMPKAGCPEGFTADYKVLRDKFGVPVPMCQSMSPALTHCIDVLQPGDRASFVLKFDYDEMAK